MRLGNRHLVDKINAMQDVVNIGRWKHCGNAAKCSKDCKSTANLNNSQSNNSNKIYLKPEIMNHIDSNLSDFNDEVISSDISDVKATHSQQAVVDHERPSSSGSAMLDRVSVKSIRSTGSSDHSASSSKRGGQFNEDGDSNQNYSEEQSSEMIVIKSSVCPKARNIVINLDDPDYFTEELTV